MGTSTSENASIVRTLFDLFLQYMYFASLTFWRNQFAVFFAPNSKSYPNSGQKIKWFLPSRKMADSNGRKQKTYAL